MECSENTTMMAASAPSTALILVIASLRQSVWSETHRASRSFSYEGWRLKFS
jgi:hypothetical protein